jgi:hypothetical protein
MSWLYEASRIAREQYMSSASLKTRRLGHIERMYDDRNYKKKSKSKAIHVTGLGGL